MKKTVKYTYNGKEYTALQDEEQNTLYVPVHEKIRMLKDSIGELKEYSLQEKFEVIQIPDGTEQGFTPCFKGSAFLTVIDKISGKAVEFNGTLLLPVNVNGHPYPENAATACTFATGRAISKYLGLDIAISNAEELTDEEKNPEQKSGVKLLPKVPVIVTDADDLEQKENNNMPEKVDTPLSEKAKKHPIYTVEQLQAMQTKKKIWDIIEDLGLYPNLLPGSNTNSKLRLMIRSCQAGKLNSWINEKYDSKILDDYIKKVEEFNAIPNEETPGDVTETIEPIDDNNDEVVDKLREVSQNTVIETKSNEVEEVLPQDTVNEETGEVDEESPETEEIPDPEPPEVEPEPILQTNSDIDIPEINPKTGRRDKEADSPKIMDIYAKVEEISGNDKSFAKMSGLIFGHNKYTDMAEFVSSAPEEDIITYLTS